MPKFMYVGDQSYTMVGISGARFHRNKINEVSDERLAGFLRTIPEQFKEVSQDDVPEYPKPVSLMPRQGDQHPDPRVSALLRGEKTDKTSDEPPVTVGNLNREDQREANTAAIAGKEGQVDEVAELADPEPVPTPETARKRK